MILSLFILIVELTLSITLYLFYEAVAKITKNYLVL